MDSHNIVLIEVYSTMVKVNSLNYPTHFHDHATTDLWLML